MSPLILIIGINALVIILRWGDHALLSLFGITFLPSQTVFASFAVTGFGMLELIIIGALAVKLFRRRQYRKLWRFPVKLAGQLNGMPISIVNLHQSGLAGFISSDAFDSEGLMKLTIQILDLDGQEVTVRGLFTPKNVRRLEGNADGLRVGGEVIWSDANSRTKVIEFCYVAEPFRARNKEWSRRSPRVSVLLQAKVNDLPAETVDLSIGGVSFQLSSEIPLEVGTAVKVMVRVRGIWIPGNLIVRYNRQVSGNNQRIGGEVAWARDDWLNDFIRLEHVAQRGVGLHAFKR